MGERIRWGPSLLFRELPSPPALIRFRSPVRWEAFLHLLIGTGCFLFALMIAVALSEPGGWRVLAVGWAALFLLPHLAVAALRLWFIRVLEVDPGREEMALILRSPFGTRRESYPFAALRRVTLEERDTFEPNPAERTCMVVVETDEGNRVELGKASRRAARHFARRLAVLTGAALRIPDPGPREFPEDPHPWSA